MINNKTVAVVVPAFNEEKQIGMVIETMPDFVDRIIIVNDSSTDRTAEIVSEYISAAPKSMISIKRFSLNGLNGKYDRAQRAVYQQYNDEVRFFTPSVVFNTEVETDRIILINHSKNAGVGAAISSGYKWCKDYNIDCTAVMAGDGQMDPDELENICRPVIDENVDYVKGNRLIHRSAWLIIPKTRYFGNSILSILTKIASGYWHISDTQNGYTAISQKAIQSVNLFKIYKKYGMPNDLLTKLNISFCTVKEVEMKPVYDVGEKSKMKISKVIPLISWLLVRCFFKRLWVKYLFRDFHPLFLLYNLSFVLLLSSIPYLVKILKFVVNSQQLSALPVLAFFFLFITGIQFLLFAMWMDIQDNERLYKN
jgi:glycosyltransferase involved in cell wall biosynthesis